MFSREDYDIFQHNIETILEDTYVVTPTEEDFKNNKYFFQRGLWSGTENMVYFYDKQKIRAHKQKLLSMCKRIPKFHKPSDDHAGTISSFEIMPNMDIISNESPEDMRYQLVLSNHFANLLCAADIAQVALVSQGNENAFLIVLDKKYRSYFEKEGQEPYED